MKSDRVFLILLFIAAIVLIIPDSNLFGMFYTSKLIDENEKIPPSSFPHGSWREKKCPNGELVEWIEITKNDPGVLHQPSRHVMYCEGENIFWIVHQNGEVSPDEYGSTVDYYGPFKGSFKVRFLLKY